GGHRWPSAVHVSVRGRVVSTRGSGGPHAVALAVRGPTAQGGGGTSAPFIWYTWPNGRVALEGAPLDRPLERFPAAWTRSGDGAAVVSSRAASCGARAPERRLACRSRAPTGRYAQAECQMDPAPPQQATHPATDFTAAAPPPCCVVGGAPAGAVLAYILARNGVHVTLLESHLDFDRDFRGDTLHPSILEVMDELGLADRLLQLP